MRLNGTPPICVKPPPMYSPGPDPASYTARARPAGAPRVGKVHEIPSQRATPLRSTPVPDPAPEVPVRYSPGPVPSSKTAIARAQSWSKVAPKLVDHAAPFHLASQLAGIPPAMAKTPLT